MIPKSHPRFVSLKTRNQIVKGVENNITSTHGLIAHGRGEAFDYLIKEKTQKFALEAIEAAACLLLLANKPIISVNGNAAALVPKELVELSKTIPAKLEVNIFHKSKKRELAIALELKKNKAKEVLLPHKGIIKNIDHNRKYCNEDGIAKADVVFVPLEDGDRCQALIKMKKKVITVDLNPMSRTAKTASITLVDNIIRVMPLLTKKVKELKKSNKNNLKSKIKTYNNKKVLIEALKYIKKV